MSQYVVAVDALACGTALKTLLQLATPSTVKAGLIEVSITFDGTVASNRPVLVTLRRQTSAGSGGASIAGNFGPNCQDEQNASTPTALTTAQQGPSGTWATEPTTGRVVRAWRVPPTSGYAHQLPLGQEIVIPYSSYLGVVVTADNAVNATVTAVWTE